MISKCVEIVPEWMPTDRRALIAIDLGAESCRVSLLRWSSGCPEIRLVHRFANSAVQSDDGLRWQLGHILEGLQEGLHACAELAPEGVRSIAVDGWAVDYLHLDENNNAVAEPFCYRDERTIAAEKAVHRLIPAKRMRQITGVQIQRINTAYQLYADSPEAICLPWLNVPEYVLAKLGGRRVAERTNASHTQLLDIEGRWSAEIFAALGIPIEQAAEVVPPGTDLGILSGELAGLAQFSETRLIAPACHDTASAIAAISDSGDDWAYVSSGTWSLIGTLLEQPLNTEAAARANFTNLAGADGKTCFHKGINGLWILRQCMEEWRIRGSSFTIDEIVRRAEKSSIGQRKLDIDDPNLMLQGSMCRRIQEQLSSRALPEIDTSENGAGEVARLIFEGLATRYAEVLRDVAQLTGRTFRRLHIVGGGSQNRLLNRLIERSTGLTVYASRAESATIGNFAIQLAALERHSLGPEAKSNLPVSVWAGRLNAGAGELKAS